MQIQTIKKFLRHSTVFVALTTSAIAADLRVITPPAASVSAINEKELRKHLEFLSSPELGGRYTLSPNFGVAARYLATRLKNYGYRGAGENGSYFQTFEVLTTRNDAEKSSLELAIGKESKSYSYGDFYNASKFAGSADGPLVFAGYGISSPAQKRDDYAGLDVKGKVVLIASGIPKDIDPSKLEDNEEDEGAARAHGAVGLVRIPSAGYINYMKNPAFRDSNLRQENSRLAADKTPRVPAIRLTPELADKILASTGWTTQKINDAVKVGAPLEVKGLDAAAKFTVATIENKVSTQNVVAILDGTDPKLRSEYVTFSAHYDHLRTNAKGEIYPGADDDGSGTSSVLNIAQVMAMNPPKRSVFIIFHAGEELGLLGSLYNADYGRAVPLQSMVVDLNIDMIGRSRPAGDTNKANEQLTPANTIYVIGADRISMELHQISEATNAATEKLKFDYTLNDPKHPERIYFRSDHWNYAKHGVPIIFYFDGIHEDYHKPTDTIDKIDFNKMTKVTRLVYNLGWKLGNMPHRPKND